MMFMESVVYKVAETSKTIALNLQGRWLKRISISIPVSAMSGDLKGDALVFDLTKFDKTITLLVDVPIVGANIIYNNTSLVRSFQDGFCERKLGATPVLIWNASSAQPAYIKLDYQ